MVIGWTISRRIKLEHGHELQPEYDRILCSIIPLITMKFYVYIYVGKKQVRGIIYLEKKLITNKILIYLKFVVLKKKINSYSLLLIFMIESVMSMKDSNINVFTIVPLKSCVYLIQNMKFIKMKKI